MCAKPLVQSLTHSKDSINIAVSILCGLFIYSTFCPFEKVKIYLRVLSVIELIL